MSRISPLHNVNAILPNAFPSYVAAIALGAIPLLSWLHGYVVLLYRRPAGVWYPNPYATAEQAKKNPMAYRLNCAQRAHAQFLENSPQTMLMMLLAGLEYPVATKWLGITWIVLRIVYWAGYVYSSKEGGQGRLYGASFWMVQGLIWFLGLLTSKKLMRGP